jgi:hypothetical protein
MEKHDFVFFEGKYFKDYTLWNPIVKYNVIFEQKSHIQNYNWRSLIARPIRKELQKIVIFCRKKPISPWALKVGKIVVAFINHKKRTQVCYYRFQNFEINSLQNSQKTFFELILRVSRKSLFLPGFFSNTFQTCINQKLVSLWRAVTIETLISMIFFFLNCTSNSWKSRNFD